MLAGLGLPFIDRGSLVPYESATSDLPIAVGVSGALLAEQEPAGTATTRPLWTSLDSAARGVGQTPALSREEQHSGGCLLSSR